MIQISTGPQPSPVCLLQRFCRRNPIHPFFAGLHVTLGGLVGAGVGLWVTVGVGEGLGVLEDVGMGVSLGRGVSVGASVGVGVGESMGVFVAVGAPAVSVATAAVCTATGLKGSTKSGVGVDSPPQAVTASRMVNTKDPDSGIHVGRPFLDSGSFGYARMNEKQTQQEQGYLFHERYLLIPDRYCLAFYNSEADRGN